MYFWIHLALAILLTGYFLFRFIKDRLIYQLLFIIWVPATLLTYIPVLGNNSTYRMILGGFQLVMFLLVIFFMFRKKPQALPEDKTESDDGEEEKAAESFFPAAEEKTGASMTDFTHPTEGKGATAEEEPKE